MLNFIHFFQKGFGHLREHKFRHNFANTLNPICVFALESECAEHLFLRCHNYILLQTILTNDLRDVDGPLVLGCCNDIPRVILYGEQRFNPCTYKRILTATIISITNTQTFVQPSF